MKSKSILSVLAVLTFLAGSSIANSVVLAEGVKSSTIKRLQKAIQVYARGEDEIELYDIIKKIGEYDDPKAAVLLPVAGIALDSKKLYDLAKTQILELENEAAIEALTKSLDKVKPESYRRAVLILDSFGVREDAASLQTITEAIDHKFTPVRLAAIRAAVVRKDKQPIPALIDAVEKNAPVRDLVWLEARTALTSLTGQDFEDPVDWRKYWQGHSDTLDPKNLETEKGRTEVSIKKSADAVEFFGTEIFSRNLVFVIDTSWSMAMYDESDDYEGTDPENARQRFRRAQEQLTGALKLLPKTTQFNVVAYNNQIISWQKKLRPATKKSVKSAVRFVDNLKMGSATHTDEALQRALQVPGVDTVVLLSDGAPIKGGRRREDSSTLIPKILKWVENFNASRQIRIHAFGFAGAGTWPERVPGMPRGGGPLPQPKPDEVKEFTEFMKELASENRGKYRPIE